MGEEWTNEVLTLCPGDKRLLIFMADDGSISTAQARDFGIEVVSSAPRRRLDADSAPPNAAALAQHRARQSRKNKVVLAELDAQPDVPSFPLPDGALFILYSEGFV